VDLTEWKTHCITYHKVTVPHMENNTTAFERQALLLFLETVAGKHRQAGILSEARVREGEFAEIEDRALRRFDTAGMYTNSTQARLGLSFRGDSGIHLAYRIAQTFFSPKIT